jgi:hypothetical protein
MADWLNLIGYTKETFANAFRNTSCPDNVKSIQGISLTYDTAIAFTNHQLSKESHELSQNDRDVAKQACIFLTWVSLKRKDPNYLQIVSDQHERFKSSLSNRAFRTPHEQSHEDLLAMSTRINGEYSKRSAIIHGRTTKDGLWKEVKQKSGHPHPIQKPPFQEIISSEQNKKKRKSTKSEVPCIVTGKLVSVCVCELCTSMGELAVQQTDQTTVTYQPIHNQILQELWAVFLTGNWTKRSMTALQFCALNYGNHPAKYIDDPSVGMYFLVDGLTKTDISNKLRALRDNKPNDAFAFLKSTEYDERTVIVEQNAPRYAPIQHKHHFQTLNEIDVNGVQLLGIITP